MAKVDYTYSIDHKTKTVSIIDLNQLNTTVTNAAEQVLTEIVSNENEIIKQYKFIYCDSNDDWDTILPEWIENKCIFADFKLGIN